MKLGQLLKPFIKKLQDGGPVNPNRFDDISGLSGDALAGYLGDTFGLQDAGKYTEYFDPYSTVGEEQLGRQHDLGVKSAQTGARNQMGDIYGKARAAGSKGGGFGGRGRVVEAAKGKTLGALQQQKAKLGETLEQGIYGEREQYVQDFMGQVGRLGSMGAQFGGATTNNTGDVYDYAGDQNFDETTGGCSPGYYMAAEGSGQQGCIPEGGGDTGGDEYVQNPDLDPAGQCASKGGIWANGACDFPGGSGDTGGGGINDTMP